MNLYQLTQLAKVNQAQAAAGILEFVQRKFSNLTIRSVQINQSAVSLNSVNGFLQDQVGRDYFFKFHAEENEQITLDEYYNTEVLARVGLPVIKPLYQSTAPGSQFLIYEKITAPTGFELFSQPELFFPAERKLLKQIQKVYLETLELTPANQIALAPIHQLFYHRLVGKPPRVDLYYTSNPWFQQLADKTWLVNDRQYPVTLNQIIIQAKRLLDPQHYLELSTVIGHGDDHNGNKFYLNGQFYFFDPAFAGRQPALLSFVKATAHNTFVHPDWLYTPEKLAEDGLELDWKIMGDTVMVQHNWPLSPDRERELQLQEDIIWKPLITELRQRGWLPKDWKDYLRAALFCCPFLVYNLLDRNRYTEANAVLALSKCIEIYSYDCDY